MKLAFLHRVRLAENVSVCRGMESVQPTALMLCNLLPCAAAEASLMNKLQLSEQHCIPCSLQASAVGHQA